MDEALPCVALLHDLTVAIWHDVHILDAYKMVGEALIEDSQLAAGPYACISEQLRASQALLARNGD
jgi:hypothetical protein